MSLKIDENSIDGIFRHVDSCHAPGVAVGIAVGGRPVYRKAFGLANAELPVALSPSTRMRINSTSKHFTCLAFMLLCEEGKANPSDPVRKYLPEIHPAADSVTVHQVMTHTSGLNDAQNIRWQFSGMERQVPSSEIFSLYESMDSLQFEPDSAWRYNNGGYLLLSQLIERIADQPLEEVFRTRIFEPVGMYDTLLRRYDRDFVPNSATLHMTNLQGEFEKFYLAGATAGEGGIVSTVDDMLSWLAHMDRPVVGSEDTWSLMRKPHVLRNGTSTGYGLGLSIHPYRGVETIYHAGGGMGANSQMLKVPAYGIDIIVMANRQDVSSGLFVNQILDTCIPDLGEVGRKPVQPPIQAIFQSPSTRRLIHFKASSRLAYNAGAEQIVSMDNTDIAFVRGEDGVLRPGGLASSMRWSLKLIGDPDDPQAVEVVDFGNRETLHRAEAADDDDIDPYVGRYRSEATGTVAIVSKDADGPRLNTVGRWGTMVFGMSYITGSLWQAQSLTNAFFLGGTIAFDTDGEGFEFSSYATSRLRFVRCES